MTPALGPNKMPTNVLRKTPLPCSTGFYQTERIHCPPKAKSQSCPPVSDPENAHQCQNVYRQQVGADTHIEVDVVHEPDGSSPKQPVPEVCDKQAEAMPVVACKQRYAYYFLHVRETEHTKRSLRI